MMKELGIGGKLWLAVFALVISLAFIVGLAGWRAAQQQQSAEAALQTSEHKLKVARQWPP